MEQPVVDRASLGVALRAIKDAQSRVAENVATHDAEVKRVVAKVEQIARWLDAETAGDKELVANLTALIRPYAIAEAERQVAMGGHKRVSVPDGDIEVRDQVPEVKRVDEEALMMWAAEHALIRRKPAPPPEVAWDEVRKLALGGEPVPGVEVVPKEPKVEVKVRRDS
jgi:hypothetical protein